MANPRRAETAAGTAATRRTPVATALAVALLGAAAAWAQPAQLELLQALPVEGLDSSQPSGLTLVDGQLYAVSDKHDHAVCRVGLRRDRAILEPYITFNAPWSGAWVRGLDFEGLAYRDGFFFIVSEATFRVLRVHETGRDVAWITPSVEAAGLAAGFFGERNARLEGLALAGPGHVILAAERQPRGLIDVFLDADGEARIEPHVFDVTSLPLRAPRPPDFTDLWFEDGTLYALARNAEAVVRLAYGEAGIEELEAWSFSQTVTDPQYQYADDTFGKAEGLAMDAERVYIILDNNGQGRAVDATDTRPLLFVFRRP